MRNSMIKKLGVFSFLLMVLLLLGIVTYSLIFKDGPSICPYPDGKNFAFTITADPDGGKLENARIIYDFLTEAGLRTTIAVWVEEPTRLTGVPDIARPKYGGDSCDRYSYLKYIQDLQRRGFEIALHTVSSGNDYSEVTLNGYERFKEYFETYPKINIMHSTNLENIYWGKKVANNVLLRQFIGLLTNKANLSYSGEVVQSKYFWGDTLKQKTKYVRLWGTSDINTLKFNPSMPYHDPQKSYVNYWFSFSDGFDVNIFNSMLSAKNIKRLIKERGASIVYLHFYSFMNNGKLNETFKSRIKYIAQQKDGWFVPASTLLDRLLAMKKVRLEVHDNSLVITNFNLFKVDGVTVLVHPYEVLYNSMGIPLKANREGEIVLDSLSQGETCLLMRDRKWLEQKNEYPTFLEKVKMVFQRGLVYLSHNY